ncbi:MAG: Hsp20/alpha crystallin family protein [Anaerolineae bacterium]|nr:Hsp20/alpha crystallin family protein [Anaerolineae bacterium]
MFRRPFGYYGYRSPWVEMERLQREMNRLFSDSFSLAGGRTAPNYPAMNVWTNEDGAVVTAELPGINPNDIDISVVGDTLTLSGERQPEALGEGDKYHRRERGCGKFNRAFQLPFKVEADKVDAIFDKGVLHLSLPRAEADKPRKITVKSA